MLSDPQTILEILEDAVEEAEKREVIYEIRNAEQLLQYQIEAEQS